MPDKSGRQHRFMEMVAHDPGAAKRVGVPRSVGKEFVDADKAEGKQFSRGATQVGKLDAKQRKAEPDSDFGLPGKRKYPMPDKSHARDAKARASEEEHKGNLSKGQEREIDAKADKKIGRKPGKGMV